jgi:hypothetical protein
MAIPSQPVTFNYDPRYRVVSCIGPHGVTQYQWEEDRLVNPPGLATDSPFNTQWSLLRLPPDYP